MNSKLEGILIKEIEENVKIRFNPFLVFYSFKKTFFKSQQYINHK
jgi:hypothetical protein